MARRARRRRVIPVGTPAQYPASAASSFLRVRDCGRFRVRAADAPCGAGGIFQKCGVPWRKTPPGTRVRLDVAERTPMLESVQSSRIIYFARVAAR
jgi:hypothetical protein